MATAECRTWVIESNELKTTDLEIRLPRWSFCKIKKKNVNNPITVSVLVENQAVLNDIQPVGYNINSKLVPQVPDVLSSEDCSPW